MRGVDDCPHARETPGRRSGGRLVVERDPAQATRGLPGPFVSTPDAFSPKAHGDTARKAATCAGMLKNLKSLFIVTDETPAPEGDKAQDDRGAASAQNPSRRPGSPPPPPARGAAPASTGTTPPSTPMREAVPAGGGAINQAIVGKLLDAIDREDLAGFDYLEYKRALKAMDPLPMDEATKFRSAFATAATLGTSLDKLVASVEHYLTILDRERGDFETVVKRELDARVAGREAELEAVEREIATKTAEIERLRAEADALRAKTAGLRDAVEESRAKIATANTEFAAAHAYVRDLFARDADKMRQYLK